MKSWINVIADEDRILDKHFTPGRAGKPIRMIALHHNAGNLSIEQCYNVWQTREASAHYQVDINGRIGQLVNDVDTAWAVGDQAANEQSISIEHADARFAPDWTISDPTLDNGAHLVAALCVVYNLGRPQWMGNVFPHSYFSQTSCPGALAGSQNGAYMQRAQEWYDAMVNGPVGPPGLVNAPSENSGKPGLPANYPLPYPLANGDYYGDINGNEHSHGGFYENERPQVRAIQQALIVQGFVPGISDPNSSWADGLFEQPTIDAATAFQKKYRPNSTQYFGQMWADDLETLRSLFA